VKETVVAAPYAVVEEVDRDMEWVAQVESGVMLSLCLFLEIISEEFTSSMLINYMI
jgi:hypothetical protein